MPQRKMLSLGAAAFAFVLTPINLTVHGIAGGARRWHYPADAASSDGLGGGITFVVESTLCAQLLPRFHESPWPVDCHAIEDAIQRALTTWSVNHPSVISFRNITGASAACVSPAFDVRSSDCPWELFIIWLSRKTGNYHNRLEAWKSHFSEFR